MDNFEWSRGYSERFGLHWVNFTDPARPVYPKKSAEWFSHLAASNSIFPKNSLRDEFWLINCKIFLKPDQAIP